MADLENVDEESLGIKEASLPEAVNYAEMVEDMEAPRIQVKHLLAGDARVREAYRAAIQAGHPAIVDVLMSILEGNNPSGLTRRDVELALHQYAADQNPDYLPVYSTLEPYTEIYPAGDVDVGISVLVAVPEGVDIRRLRSNLPATSGLRDHCMDYRRRTTRC